MMGGSSNRARSEGKRTKRSAVEVSKVGVVVRLGWEGLEGGKTSVGCNREG